MKACGAWMLVLPAWDARAETPRRVQGWLGSVHRSRTRPRITISCRSMEPCVSRESGEPCNPVACDQGIRAPLRRCRSLESFRKQSGHDDSPTRAPKPEPRIRCSRTSPRFRAPCCSHRLYHTEETNNVHRLLTKIQGGERLCKNHAGAITVERTVAERLESRWHARAARDSCLNE